MSRRYIERARFAQLPSISADLLEHHSTSYGPHLEYLLRLNLLECGSMCPELCSISSDLARSTRRGGIRFRGLGVGIASVRKKAQVSPPISIPKKTGEIASGVGKASTEKVAGYDHSLIRRWRSLVSRTE